MKDLLGNKTEESIREFIKKLDENKDLGPKPIKNVSFNENIISDIIECDDEIALKLFTEPSPFMYDDNDDVYVEVRNEETGNMDKFYLISNTKDPSFQVICESIASNLPEVTYDIECGGYPSRQIEAASLYKVSIINKLQEGQYDLEIREALSGYDFDRWVGSSGNYVFTELLQKIQEEADSISRVVLMCANNKLVADRVKKDTSYKGILKEEDAEKLRLLSEEDAFINFTFNKRYETATSAKEKILLGEELAEARKKMLSTKVISNEISVLFSIYKLNQNAIPGRAKRIIRNAASNYVMELTSKAILHDKESTAEFKKKLIKRAQKLFLVRMKQIRYKLWRDRTPELDLSTLLPKY